LPKLESFKLETNGWTVTKNGTNFISWRNDSIPDFRVQSLSLNPPNDLPANYPDLKAHYKLFEELSKKDGSAVVSIDFLNVKGVEAFQTILKYRMEARPLGRMYLGTLMFPMETFFCGIQFVCNEFGTTNLRESLAYLTHPDSKKAKSEPEKSPVVINSADEFFDHLKEQPIIRLPSDDEIYDGLIPDHPLTHVRKHLKHLAATIEFDKEIFKTKPHRGIDKRNSLKTYWERMFKINKG
jgi:hypothetical protein